ncbi:MULTISPECIES: DUF4127 family protein [Paenibacillus]|uniref:DUF4127 family protein n=1 Tax=Paenibacillus TaxID=44249 RepID=UPI002FE170A3
MTTKIVYIPLDERPCNAYFPKALAAATEFSVVTPPPEMMGNKKSPADTERIWTWLLEEAKGAVGAIVSLDTLVYGGIIPSRLHDLTDEECRARLQRVHELKAACPGLTLYALNLVMRCPQYSSSDEEPDYYGVWGRDIFRLGYITHRAKLGLATEEETKELEEINFRLPEAVLNDYLRRRAANVRVNRLAVELAKEGMLDFLIIPQDDSAPYGWTTMDQLEIRRDMESLGAGLKVYMYPGADEVGCTLLARMVNRFRQCSPQIYPRFSSAQGPFVIPLYEDRVLFESVKYQVLAAGGLLCSSVTEADLVLLVNSPGETMMESVLQHQPGADVPMHRNLVELVESADYLISRARKPCIVADVAYANGSDLQLIRLLREKGLLFRLAGYAGWNTSSNTLGTCIAQGMMFHLYGETPEHLDFLSLRYTEDAGYCSYVRQHVKENRLPELGMDYFSIDGQRGKVSCIIREELNRFVDRYLNDDAYRIVIDDVYMPWSRMFEVGLRTHLMPSERS